MANIKKGLPRSPIIIVLLVIIISAIVLVFLQTSQFKNSSRPNEKQAENSNVKMANPASENCISKGGTLSILKRGDGGEYGLCNFEDNMSCEEWALYRNECPVGGVKTTGYDTTDQMYCAWIGGQTLAVENSICTFPDGNSCSTIDLYNGKCSPNK